jgi:hypothetical protein
VTERDYLRAEVARLQELLSQYEPVQDPGQGMLPAVPLLTGVSPAALLLAHARDIACH